MNAHELRTLAKKAETQPEIVVRKAEKNLRQTENSQFKLRLFRVYQPLTSISQQKLNFLRQPLHTTIVDSADLSLLLSPLARAARTVEGEGRQSQPRVSSPPFAKRTSPIGQSETRWLHTMNIFKELDTDNPSLTTDPDLPDSTHEATRINCHFGIGS